MWKAFNPISFEGENKLRAKERSAESQKWLDLARTISRYASVLQLDNSINFLVHIKKSIDYLNNYDENSVGGIFIGEKDLSFKPKGELCNFDNARYSFLRQSVGHYLTSVKLPHSLQRAAELKQSLDSVSIFHAISRIIARDSAHHIGSHVSFNSTNQVFKERFKN